MKSIESLMCLAGGRILRRQGEVKYMSIFSGIKHLAFEMFHVCLNGNANIFMPHFACQVFHVTHFTQK